MQLLPIGNAIMYVRPVWILGEGNTTFPRYEFVAAAVGQHAVLGCDMTDAVTALVNNTPTRLQASQNRTNGCNTGSTLVTTPTTGGNGSTTTTTTVPGATTTTTLRPRLPRRPRCSRTPRTSSISPNRRNANNDLGGYQQHIEAARGRRPGGLRQTESVDIAHAHVPASTTTPTSAKRAAVTTTTGAP